MAQKKLTVFWWKNNIAFKLAKLKYYICFKILFIIMNTSKTYRIVLRKEAEGAYTAMVPALPGCITWGENIDHALAMAKEAIEGYIEVLKEEGESVPDDNDTLEYSLQLTT